MIVDHEYLELDAGLTEHRANCPTEVLFLVARRDDYGQLGRRAQAIGRSGLPRNPPHRDDYLERAHDRNQGAEYAKDESRIAHWMVYDRKSCGEDLAGLL